MTTHTHHIRATTTDHLTTFIDATIALTPRARQLPTPPHPITHAAA